jgi:glycosyltransferase involved in cell wall biosynthesis
VTRLKVLLSAYACAPGQGSEPGVGWNVARAVARHHDVWVLTRANNRVAIEAELARAPVPGLHFVYHDLPRWARIWKKGNYGIELYYYLWQISAFIPAYRLHRAVGFDLAHHVTFVRYWAPSFLALMDLPYVWGPVGGGESTPAPFRATFGLRGRVYEILRDLARSWAEHGPLVRLTNRRSRVALATTEQTAARLRQLGAQDVRVALAIGLPLEEISGLNRIPAAGDFPVRFFSIGRLLHWKGFHLAIEAFAQAGTEGAEFWIFGDGRDRTRLGKLAEKLGIAESVIFWGELPRDEVLGKLAHCHVLVHPSLHESGGGVCLESMAAGRPVICLDLGGPATQVTAESGIKVAANDPDQAVGDLAAAMTRLAGDSALRGRMARAASERVAREFEWSHKAALISDVYAEALQPRGAATRFVVRPATE